MSHPGAARRRAPGPIVALCAALSAAGASCSSLLESDDVRFAPDAGAASTGGGDSGGAGGATGGAGTPDSSGTAGSAGGENGGRPGAAGNSSVAGAAASGGVGLGSGGLGGEAGLRCDPSAPLGPLEAVTWELDDTLQALGPVLFDGAAAEGPVRFSWDGLDVLLKRRSTGWEWGYTAAASRTSLQAPFPPLSLLATPEAGGVQSTGTGTFLPGGLEIIVECFVANYQLCAAARRARGEVWGALEVMDAPNTDDAEYEPFVTSEGLELYFTRARVGSVASLFVTSRSSILQRFPAVSHPLSVSDEGNNYRPVLSSDGRTLYFASDRRPSEAVGGVDIWGSRREGPGAPWSPPVLMPELSTPGDDSPSWISSDGCEVYTTVEASAGRETVYRALRGR